MTNILSCGTFRPLERLQDSKTCYIGLIYIHVACYKQLILALNTNVGIKMQAWPGVVLYGIEQVVPRGLDSCVVTGASCGTCLLAAVLAGLLCKLVACSFSGLSPLMNLHNL